MERYDFAIMDGRETQLVARDVLMTDRQAIWVHVGRIARAFRRPGRLIRVTNASGGIVMLIGVATALQLYTEITGGAPPL